jgi:hypothetical protein
VLHDDVVETLLVVLDRGPDALDDIFDRIGTRVNDVRDAEDAVVLRRQRGTCARLKQRAQVGDDRGSNFLDRDVAARCGELGVPNSAEKGVTGQVAAASLLLKWLTLSPQL